MVEHRAPAHDQFTPAHAALRTRGYVDQSTPPPDVRRVRSPAAAGPRAKSVTVTANGASIVPLSGQANRATNRFCHGVSTARRE